MGKRVIRRKVIRTIYRSDDLPGSVGFEERGTDVESKTIGGVEVAADR